MLEQQHDSDVEELLRNPFVLRLFVEALPSMLQNALDVEQLSPAQSSSYLRLFRAASGTGTRASRGRVTDAMLRNQRALAGPGTRRTAASTVLRRTAGLAHVRGRRVLAVRPSDPRSASRRQSKSTEVNRMPRWATSESRQDGRWSAQRTCGKNVLSDMSGLLSAMGVDAGWSASTPPCRSC